MNSGLYFDPPSFFDIMVHLPIHLANEVRLGGPVQFRWMYPTERNLCKLKSYVRNRAHPEGSTVEAYLAEKALTFCSRYLHDNVDTRLNRKSRNYDNSDLCVVDLKLKIQKDNLCLKLEDLCLYKSRIQIGSP